MHRYSWPGQRSRVSNVTPIQMPPDPMPIRSRAGKYIASELPRTKPSVPSATSASEPMTNVVNVIGMYFRSPPMSPFMSKL